MNNIDKLNDRELVDFTYGIAGEHLRNKITDWSDWKKWRETVLELDEPVRFTYYIGILNSQVMNGGFMQYYDNDYGIFSRETMIALKMINADFSSNLLSKSIEILEKYKNPRTDWHEFIADKKYWDKDEIELVFSKLDTKYYELEEKENLETILAVLYKDKQIGMKPGYNNVSSQFVIRLINIMKKNFRT